MPGAGLVYCGQSCCPCLSPTGLRLAAAAERGTAQHGAHWVMYREPPGCPCSGRRHGSSTARGRELKLSYGPQPDTERTPGTSSGLQPLVCAPHPEGVSPELERCHLRFLPTSVGVTSPAKRLHRPQRTCRRRSQPLVPSQRTKCHPLKTAREVPSPTLAGRRPPRSSPFPLSVDTGGNGEHVPLPPGFPGALVPRVRMRGETQNFV